MTQPEPAPAGDRLFALIASIPSSGSVDWCGPARALLDEVRAEAVEAAAVPAGVAPDTDRAQLRDAIRRAVCEAEGFAWDSDMLEPDEYGDHADMVLAVLPTSVDQATVLEEVADRYQGFIDNADTGADPRYWTGIRDMVIGLRHMAAESVPAVAGPADDETAAELQVWPLQRVLAEVRCGSQDWTWDEEWADLDWRHAETGYLDQLEQKIRVNGITMPVLIGSDGRLWDGHHRLRLAVRLGIGYVPVEVVQPAGGAQQPKETRP